MAEDATENPRRQASPGNPPGSASETMPDYTAMRKLALMDAARDLGVQTRKKVVQMSGKKHRTWRPTAEVAADCRTARARQRANTGVNNHVYLQNKDLAQKLSKHRHISLMRFFSRKPGPRAELVKVLGTLLSDGAT